MTFTQDWINNQDIIPHWIEHLSPLSEQKVKMLEIGCFEGRSTVWFLQNVLKHKESTITVLDTFEGDTQQEVMGVNTKGIYDRFLENTKEYNNLTVIKGDSKAVMKTLQGEYDVIYVDGSHYQVDVLRDMVLAFDLLKKGGIMACDDYNMTFDRGGVFNKPRIAIDAFCHVYGSHIKPLHTGWQFIFKKI